MSGGFTRQVPSRGHTQKHWNRQHGGRSEKAYPAIEASPLDEGILIQKSTDNKYMLQFSIKDDKVAGIVLVQDLVIK